MRGPYRVTKVLPSGRYELKLLSGAKGKTTQAAAQYMVPWKGKWCPESCAAFFEKGVWRGAGLVLCRLSPAHPKTFVGPRRPRDVCVWLPTNVRVPLLFD
ncbi:hypothetical protein K1T71_014879 [Dendrolimus kikuchii]|nr:hypothetical protein K1T71_014879 [Dendrolimus kikuchii]